MKPRAHIGSAPAQAGWPGSGRRRAGFTLIEIIVVIGILAVLGVLLFPAVRRVIATSQATKCASNLRQIGVGFSLFAAEHSNTLPAKTSSTPASNSTFAFGGKAGAASPYDILLPTGRPINEYVLTMKEGDEMPDSAFDVFHCPADEGASEWTGDEASMFDYAGTSYVWNSRSPNPDFTTLLGKPMDQIRYPTRTVLAGDFTIRNYRNDEERGINWHGLAENGAPLANYLFVDGHVELLPVGIGNETDDYTHLPW